MGCSVCDNATLNGRIRVHVTHQQKGFKTHLEQAVSLTRDVVRNVASCGCPRWLLFSVTNGGFVETWHRAVRS